MDALVLSRAQFAANITFHILFPTISVGLGWLLLWFRLRWLRTRNASDPSQAQGWLDAYRFWTKVFALSFALGVVSGITMSFQFGTNWPGFMQHAGNVAGPLLGYEVLTAFFLEAGFLGVMLFGHGKVSERVHLMSTFFVAFGTTLSAFWILALNSWMQTPAGAEVIDGVYHVTSWVQVIFNPSFPYRFTHMMLASALTCAFLVTGLSAWQVLHGTGQRSAPRVMRIGLSVAAVVMPLQILAGDAHGLNTLAHQPAKIAAMEGVWNTESGAPLLLFAIPDAAARTNHFEVKVPRLASLILTHDPDGQIQGLNAFGTDHPPPLQLFFAFRVMVGVGVLMLATSWLCVWALRRARWQPGALDRRLLWWLAGMTFSGWVATVAGWYVSEIGRQPFLVYGQLRTADAVSQVAQGMVGLTLALYITLYVALIVAYVTVLKYMAEKPDEPSGQGDTPAPGPAGRLSSVGAGA